MINKEIMINPFTFMIDLWTQFQLLLKVLIDFLTTEITVAGQTFKPLDGLAIMTGIFIVLYLIKKFVPGL